MAKHYEENTMDRRGNTVFTGLLGFLSLDKWAELTLFFSVVWVLAALYVCVVNYISTYIGIQTLFPVLAPGVIVAFVIFVQGSEFVVPILEGLNLHSEIAHEFRLGFRIAWFVAIVVDYITAWIWFNLQANVTFDTVGPAFTNDPVRMIFTEVVILVFSLIFLVAEVLVVVGVRAVLDRGAVVWKKLNVSVDQPAVSPSPVADYRPSAAESTTSSESPAMRASGLSMGDVGSIFDETRAEAEGYPLPEELREIPVGWRVKPLKSKPGSFLVNKPGGASVTWSPGDPTPW